MRGMLGAAIGTVLLFAGVLLVVSVALASDDPAAAESPPGELSSRWIWYVGGAAVACSGFVLLRTFARRQACCACSGNACGAEGGGHEGAGGD